MSRRFLERRKYDPRTKASRCGITAKTAGEIAFVVKANRSLNWTTAKRLILDRMEAANTSRGMMAMSETLERRRRMIEAKIELTKSMQGHELTALEWVNVLHEMMARIIGHGLRNERDEDA